MSDPWFYALLTIVLFKLLCAICAALNAHYCAPGDWWWDE